MSCCCGHQPWHYCHCHAHPADHYPLERRTKPHAGGGAGGRTASRSTTTSLNSPTISRRCAMSWQSCATSPPSAEETQ